MVTQLRLYTIQEGRLDDFIAAWRAGVYPLRTTMGYTIQAWAVRERDEFVWLLSYDGPEPWEDMERAYYASPERKALDPDPVQYLVSTEQRFLEPVTLKVSPADSQGDTAS
jgi:hypothetical protein